MQTAPKGMRLHIGIFGRRNAGKSSLLNALTGQNTSIVSDQPGTTTDPVEKPMELLPLGPVLFIDTAGIDDTGALGEQRVERTRQVFDRTDIAIVVAVPTAFDTFERDLIEQFRARKIPCIVALNKCDSAPAHSDALAFVRDQALPYTAVSAVTRTGIPELKQHILRAAPDTFISREGLLAGLVPPGGTAVLVMPIDKEAPRGRIILPQVQAIRDLLDHDCIAVVATEHQLRGALENLRTPPALVVTDSQAFAEVSAQTAPGIPLTSFSILLARYQADLPEMTRGSLAIGSLKTGNRVLIAESCTHHPIEDDIGTVKIPRWLKQRTGADLQFTHMRGHDFPSDLAEFNLVVHCGACMWNRREMLSRILRCRQAGVPITNYGLTIAFCLGILKRALSPFPEVLEQLNAEGLVL